MQQLGAAFSATTLPPYEEERSSLSRERLKHQPPLPTSIDTLEIPDEYKRLSRLSTNEDEDDDDEDADDEFVTQHGDILMFCTSKMLKLLESEYSHHAL